MQPEMIIATVSVIFGMAKKTYNGYEVRPRRGHMFIEAMYTSVVRPRRGRIETRHFFL
jgi:hypothetical protein